LRFTFADIFVSAFTTDIPKRDWAGIPLVWIIRFTTAHLSLELPFNVVPGNVGGFYIPGVMSIMGWLSCPIAALWSRKHQGHDLVMETSTLFGG
jgi:hypothetical protein